MNSNILGQEALTTLYSLADRVMREYIRAYLQLVRESTALAAIRPEHVESLERKIIVLGGINSPLDPDSVTAEDVVREWQRMQAVPFDIEPAITRGVYLALRRRTETMLVELEEATHGFLSFDASYIMAKPWMLPILQRLANISSKAELKRKIGNVSDNVISSRAASVLAEMLNERAPGRVMSRAQVLQGVEPTLEGIVRDLVGRVLLESVVANALDDAGVPYQRENEYAHLPGVVYDFRADFVSPDAVQPKAFIEVRKSSSRHASLYAKDKMFSAINWKGYNRDLVGILVADGPWTAETLRVMANVFDYVVPLNRAGDVASAVAAYIGGDKSILKWLIDFRVQSASEGC